MKKRSLPLSILSLLVVLMLSFQVGNVLAEDGGSAAAETEKSEGFLDKVKGLVSGSEESEAEAAKEDAAAEAQEATSEAGEAASEAAEAASEEAESMTDKAKSMIKGE